MSEISLLDMLKSGVHFGHQQKNWHPKMKPFLFTTRAGVHIIDLEQTAAKLKEACDYIRDIVARGGSILMVASKHQAQAIVKEAAQSVGMPYVTERWVGGILTNFDNIYKLVKRLKDLRGQRESGELAKYTKREQLQFSEEITNLEKLIGGIETMDRLPAALFVIDTKKEKTAVREAKKMKVPVVAMVDSNVNPDLAAYPIPANDDATKSIRLIVSAITDTIREGQELAATAKAKAVAAAAQTETKPATINQPA